jgi:DNA-binding NtrC family response regulator/tetratricopeptide (TPR) repeat protein
VSLDRETWHVLGRSKPIRAILADLERLAPSLGVGHRVPPILLQGETGTGKGLLARTIHQASPRAAGPFVDLNCAAIPATLIEAELFGFERGTFTDARQSRIGLIQAAHTGTLFLDEIGLLPTELQTKLLTVLESREVRRLGSTRAQPVDVLVIAATNTELQAAVRDGGFREDLYHRLAVLVFSLPALRDRGEDILELADEFLARAWADHGLGPKALTADARGALLNHGWPGNVRELANLIERAALLTSGVAITARNLSLPAPRGVAESATPLRAGKPPLKASIDLLARERVEEALTLAQGNISAAAERLGIPRSTLRYQMARLRVSPGRTRGLAALASRPGGALPPEERSRTLAERILASGGERKQLTVLFARVERFMDADRSPAEARDVVDAVIDQMVEAVQRHEGLVNQVTDGGIMALFGAAAAREDHAVRACYAALAMHQSIGRHAEKMRSAQGIDVRVRIGIHSGDVVVRAVGDEVRLDYRAASETTQRATRMEQLARPGSTVITTETLRLAEGFIDAVGATSGDGHELRGPSATRSRLAAAISRGLMRFVGREAEIAQLLACVERVREGRGQVAALVGEAGVGKSRLLYEMTHSHPLDGWLVLESASVSFGKATSYLPVIDLLKGYFKVRDRDDVEDVRAKVTGTVLALDRALEPTLPALLALLGVPPRDHGWDGLERLQRRSRTLDAVKHLLLRVSQAQPLLLIVEDLHWMDAESQLVFDTLVDSVGAARVLLLVSHRPEYGHGWSGKTYYRQLRVDPLPPAMARDLLDGFLGTDPSLGPLRHLLVERTEGNPLFVEESVRALVETGALAGERGAYRLLTPLPNIEVPATVHAVLAARIDRLPPEERALLHAASTIGMDVPMALLESIADLPDDTLRRGLDHLQAAEFLYATSLAPELRYTFTHTLTHDVAYGSLLHERRRTLHARIVQAIERLSPDRLDEHLDQLAHHAVRGELWDRAVEFLRRAAAGVTRSAYHNAAAYYEQALAALGQLPDGRAQREQGIDLHFELGRCLYSIGHFDRAMSAYRDAERLAVALGDEHRVARVCTGVAYLLGSEADHHGSIEAGERALAVLTRVDDPALQIWTQVGMAREYFAVGDYRRGIERAAAALETLERAPAGTRFRNLPPSVGSRTWRALCLAMIGQFDEAMTWAGAAIEYADKDDAPLPQVWANYTLGRILCLRGHFARALTFLERAASLLERGQFPIYAPRVLASLGTVYTVTGTAHDGLALLERAVVEGEAHRVLFEHAMVVVQLGAAHLAAQCLEEAERRATSALACAGRDGEKGNEAWANHLLGRVAAARPTLDADGAFTHTTLAMTMARELGMRPLVAHCHLGLARLHRRTGQRQEADENLAAATTMYREMDMRFWLERAEAETA